MRTRVNWLKYLFGGVIGAFLVASCADRITSEIKPVLNFEIIQGASDSSINIRFEAVNPYSRELEYGLMITRLDSMSDPAFYEDTQEGIRTFTELDLFFNAGNPLFANTRLKAIGKIRGGENLRVNDFLLDSLTRNSGYIIRAYMKGDETLIYSKSRSFRSSDRTAMRFVGTLNFPFSPSSYVSINDKVYFLGDKLAGSPAMFSYTLGTDNYQTMASNPLNSAQFPKSAFAVKDDAGKILYFVQESVGSGRKYKRASYDPVANVWNNEGNTCGTSGDTALIENAWAYMLKGRMVTSQVFSNSQYRMSNSTPLDYCPLSTNQLITLLNCSPDKFTLNVSNTMVSNDTVFIANQVGNSLAYLYSPISQAFVCGEINFDPKSFNPKQIFVYKGRIYSIVYTDNKVNGRKELMIYRLSFPNNLAVYQSAYNLSNSGLVQQEPFKNGIIRHFARIGNLGYLFLQDGADPNRIHIYSFSE